MQRGLYFVPASDLHLCGRASAREQRSAVQEMVEKDLSHMKRLEGIDHVWSLPVDAT